MAGISIGSSFQLTSPQPHLANASFPDAPTRLAQGQLRHVSWRYSQDNPDAHYRIKPLAICFLADGITPAVQFDSWGTLEAHWRIMPVTSDDLPESATPSNKYYTSARAALKADLVNGLVPASQLPPASTTTASAATFISITGQPTDNINLGLALNSRFNNRGAWTASTLYQPNDAVNINGGTYYNAGAAFTSGTAFLASNWVAFGAGLYTTIDYMNEVRLGIDPGGTNPGSAANSYSLTGVGGKSYVLNNNTAELVDPTTTGLALPASSIFFGRLFAFRNVGPAVAIVRVPPVANGAPAFDGAASVALQPGEWLVLKADFAAGGYTKVMRGTTAGPSTIAPATTTTAGVVKIGSGISVTADGTISASARKVFSKGTNSVSALLTASAYTLIPFDTIVNNIGGGLVGTAFTAPATDVYAVVVSLRFADGSTPMPVKNVFIGLSSGGATSITDGRWRDTMSNRSTVDCYLEVMLTAGQTYSGVYFLDGFAASAGTMVSFRALNVI